MRILITGGAGCLGSNLVEHWLPKNYEIIVIDNFATGKREVVPDGIAGLTVIEGSVVDSEFVDKVFTEHKPDIVVHSAAAYKDPDDWQEDALTNVLGAINIAKASEQYDVKQVINFQTALCYGIPQKLPIPVEHPTNAFTSYGISKTAGEAFLLNSNAPVLSLRLANICSPRLSIGPIPTFYKRLKAGQSCFCSETIRDFIDISDFLQLMDMLIAKEGENGVYNVSTGEGKTIKDVFDCVSNYLNLSNIDVPILPPGDDDIPVVVLDPSKTMEVFSWQAKVSFQDMIEKQLAWYDKYGITDIFSHLKNK
ncbi:nucleotide sugar epimerase [Saccharobesus litoralis]|uniref:Nucleotide sugar epimerase n=1 Tax=Saccharobesus litoralis TaxID=2172099 RepID=A0A2S0VU83_9ALTE|nr:NAD-dependent epimerase/dehydratase family protein [Saccharobesus litoralis]AWB67777.1 nucleotide sugar epimerase [Saccharobesus litoralis]